MSHRQTNFLFVVATPIGNLKDITIRALDVLKAADLVVSEHVRKTRNLLRDYGIKTKVLSYREENSARMIPTIVQSLKDGRSVALVAEAGTPGISDPGRRLVQAVLSQGLRVVPVPGPSAVISAVSVSGMDEPRFVFEGFLPRRPAKRRKRLLELAGDERQLVFYEAPHRLLACLEDMKQTLGDRQCVVAREITKLHEEIAKGSISSFIARYERSKPKGEFVIVCEGKVAEKIAPSPDRLMVEALAMLGRGIKKREAARVIAKKYGLKGGDVYRILIDKSISEGQEKGDSDEG
jgi:16S rRNA (cytidine1402-2'-O)-methyltransferase